MSGWMMLTVLVPVVALLVPLLLPYPEGLEILPFQPSVPLPLEGVLAPNERLLQAKKMAEGKVDGPEALTLDATGRVYLSTSDGKIVMDDGTTFADTKGRPLGIAFDANGDLIVCDVRKGLLKVDKNTKEVTVLASEVEGTPITTANDLAISKDGTIYFTDATSVPSRLVDGKFKSLEASVVQIISANPTGRLLRYDPKTKEVKVLMSGLLYANGVALSEKEDFVVVCETGKYQLQKYWLKGEKAGQSEPFVTNLPGMPDNASRGEGGKIWIAVYTVRNKLLDFIHPYPWMKQIVSYLPNWIRPKPAKYGFVVAVNEKGEILDSLQDPTGEIAPVTCAMQRGEKLYIGSLTANFYAVLNLNE